MFNFNKKKETTNRIILDINECNEIIRKAEETRRMLEQQNKKLKRILKEAKQR